MGRRHAVIREKQSNLFSQPQNLGLQWDNYTCTVCGYKLQRHKGEVHDLEIHHNNPKGDYSLDNLQTVCLPCHQHLTGQAD
ncbi:MAG: HNH endonuclease [Anaerolineae bacterium]|nr:HNH endonuclease [Anaerolineae bacterium]